MTFCVHMYFDNNDNLQDLIEFQGHKSHQFLCFFCVHDSAATRGQYLALSKAWRSCCCAGLFLCNAALADGRNTEFQASRGRVLSSLFKAFTQSTTRYRSRDEHEGIGLFWLQSLFNSPQMASVLHRTFEIFATYSGQFLNHFPPPLYTKNIIRFKRKLRELFHNCMSLC